MTIVNGKSPLLVRYRQKVVVGACVLVPFCLITLFPGTASKIIGASEWQVALAGVVGFAAILFWLAWGMKCPACGTNLFWYAFGHAKNGNWIDWLLRQTTCPKCGHNTTKPNDSRS
jgi:hypothetical protein